LGEAIAAAPGAGAAFAPGSADGVVAVAVAVAVAGDHRAHKKTIPATKRRPDRAKRKPAGARTSDDARPERKVQVASPTAHTAQAKVMAAQPRFFWGPGAARAWRPANMPAASRAAAKNKVDRSPLR
jgi:hypothetical protein